MSELTGWLTRRVEFSLGGQKWPLIFTHRVLIQCQQLTGIDTLNANLNRASGAFIRALFFSALQCAGVSCSIDDVGRVIGRIRIEPARLILRDAWLASLPDPVPEPKKNRKRSEDLDWDIEPEQKAPTWLDAWAAARLDLGLSSDEWLDMTPRMTGALYKVRLGTMQREEMLAGIIASTVANFSQSAPKTPLSAEAFMMHPLDKPDIPIGDHIFREMKKFKPREF